MPKFVSPKVFMVGATSIDLDGLVDYLKHSNNEEFLEDINSARNENVSYGEILCSFYAKLCYKSLTVGQNKNISKVRSIQNNIIATIESEHGSVFEHCYLNFVATDVSRVFTHELVRHRVGTSFSQTSGRYVRTDEIGFVYDPILDPAIKRICDTLKFIEEQYKLIEKDLDIDNVKDFSYKKKLTSAMRRILPNGQSNEIGFGLNLRTLRFVLKKRTDRAAEWEIRTVFQQVYEICLKKYPGIFADCKETIVDGLVELDFKYRI